MTAAFPQAHSAVAVAALPVAAIGPSPSNPRKHIDEAYLDELAASITSHGVIQPITVRPNPRGADPLYELVVGECRWRAAQRAGLTDIPAFWRELDDKQVLEIQVIENLQRRDVHPIDEAEGYEQLMKHHGYKAEEIAAKIGKSKAYVYARLKLTALCKTAREAFFGGKLDASTALLVARIPGARLQQKAVKAITESAYGEPMSYRSAIRYIRDHFTVSLAQATFPLGEAELVPAAGACAECPKRSGNDRALADHFGDADVCTDTACFEDKRAARHLQLIALAESRQIPVLRGEAAEEIAPGGRLWNINRDRHTMLDDVVEGDAEQRTYREILGDEAPVSALIEFDIGPGKRLVEVAETTAIEAALEKAGWQPAAPPETPEEETDEQRAKREALAAGKAAREAKAQQVEAEQTWRTRLADTLWPKLRAECSRDGELRDQVLRIAAIAWLRQETAWGEWPEALLERFGFTLPEEFDDDEALEKVGAAMAGWPIGDVLVFLLDAFTQFERREFYGDDCPPVTLLALAQAVGLDAENLRDPETTPDPIPAAQAPKTNAVEPAAPANEPAVPVKPTAWKQAWPFAIPETSVEAEKPALAEPNANGVYPEDKAEVLAWKSGKQRVTIRLLETAAGWIHSLKVEHRHGSASGPLKIHDGVTWTSRDAALQDAADEALDRCLAPQVDHGYTAKEKKALREWLTELARSAKASA